MSVPWEACPCSAQKASMSQVRSKSARLWGALTKSCQLCMTSTDASLIPPRYWVAEFLGTSGPNTRYRGKPRALQESPVNS